jgi:hypothetical protein
MSVSDFRGEHFRPSVLRYVTGRTIIVPDYNEYLSD